MASHRGQALADAVVIELVPTRDSRDDDDRGGVGYVGSRASTRCTCVADHSPSPRAVDALRTATEPLTAREIAERVLAAAKVDNPKKADLADLTGSILASLRNHKGKGVERTNEGAPARWQLATN
jgi:hypothetical protein